MTIIYLGKRPTELALLPWLQIYHDNKENRRAFSDSPMDVYTCCHLYGTHKCWLYINCVGKCHHFTLTESLVIEQIINLLVAGSEFKKKR